MSYVPLLSGDLSSHIDKFAPNTSSIDEFKAEEFPSADPGILAEFQGGNKSTSTAGGVEGMSREDIVEEDDVVRHDLLVCQPCDEDENVEVVAEGKTNSRSKKRKRGMTMEYSDEYVDDNDENVDSWNGDDNGGENNDDEYGVTWNYCKDCDYKAKRKDHLKRHRTLIHNKNATWHYCKYCDYKTKKKSYLETHRAIHNWHRCKDCDYKTKHQHHLKQHRASIHNENVTWHYCNDCDYKTNHEGNLKRHRASIHK
jgi:hypothetical protein